MCSITHFHPFDGKYRGATAFFVSGFTSGEKVLLVTLLVAFCLINLLSLFNPSVAFGLREAQELWQEWQEHSHYMDVREPRGLQ